MLKPKFDRIQTMRLNPKPITIPKNYVLTHKTLKPKVSANILNHKIPYTLLNCWPDRNGCV